MLKKVEAIVRPGAMNSLNRATNRDRGASHEAAPPTPPGIRVRTTAVRRIKRLPAFPWRGGPDGRSELW